MEVSKFHDHCLFCLENRDELRVMKKERKKIHIQPLLHYITGRYTGQNSSENDAANIVQRVTAATLIALPPLCLQCYDKLEELQKLHENLLEIQRLVEKMTLEIRKKVRECRVVKPEKLKSSLDTFQEKVSTKSQTFHAIKHLHDQIIATEKQRCHLCWTLNIWTSGPDAAKSHMEEHLGHPGWICEQCSKVYSSRNLFLDHLKNNTLCRIKMGPQNLVCYLCQPAQEFKTEKDLFEHIFNLHEKDESLEKSHKCKMCPSEYRTGLGLDFHLNSHVTERMWQALVRKGAILCPTKIKDSVLCKICNKRGSGGASFAMDDFEVHLRTVHQLENFIRCRLCANGVSIDHHEYIQHLRKFHKVKGVRKPCHICDPEKTFELIDNLHRHYFHTHKIGSQFLCEHCHKVFYTRDRLHYHVRCFHPDPSETFPFSCELCVKSGDIRYSRLSSKEALEKHLKNIHYEGRFKCGRCPAQFRGKFDFVEHEKNFHENDPLICASCGAQFNLTEKLRYHEKTAHSSSKPEVEVRVKEKAATDRNFKCLECGKGFKTKISLQIHGKVHSTVREFQCEQCPKSYKWNQHLKQHQLTHLPRDRSRPFVCATCSKAFFTKKSLKLHEQIHTGERPFSCQFCGMTFGQRSNLRAHEKRHKKKDENFSSKGTPATARTKK